MPRPSYQSDLRWLIYGLTCVAIVGFIVIGIATLAKGELFGVFGIAAAVWAVYFTGWRQATELSIADEKLSWRAPFASGIVPLETLRPARVRLWSNSLQIRAQDGTRIYILRGSGLRAFLDAWRIGKSECRSA
jgi:hypothetical protein